MFCCLFGSFHEGVSVPVGFAVEADDPAVVDDAVDDRGGHVPVAEHVAPSAGLEVRGGDDAAGLVAVRDDLEQESDDAIASCLFPGSIPCWASCCQGASWSIVDFLGDYVEPIPHEREVCDWNLGACKCVKMRGSAREKCSNLL